MSKHKLSDMPQACIDEFNSKRWPHYENRQLREENEKLKSNVDRMTRNNIELQAQYKKEIERVKDVCKGLNSQLNDKNEYSCKLFTENEKLTAENKQLFDNVEQLKAENKQYDDGFVLCNECMKNNIKSIIGIRKTVSNQEKEIEQLKAENEEIKKQKEFLIEQYNIFRKEIEQLKAQLQRFESKPANEDAHKYNCDTCRDNKGFYVTEYNGRVNFGDVKAQYIECPTCSGNGREYLPMLCRQCSGFGQVWQLVLEPK